jgi:hypothetical protein
VDLIEILENQRQIYLRQLDEFWQGKIGAKEILIAYNSDKPPLLLNLTRFDYLEKQNDDFNIEELSPDTYINHQTAEFVAGNLTIELNPFYWHGCEFILNKKISDTTFIEEWAKQWIDEDDLLQQSSEGYSNAIHSVTIPEIVKNETKFTVDFGTASVDCFLDLINIIVENNIDKVTINSFDLIE